MKIFPQILALSWSTCSKKKKKKKKKCVTDGGTTPVTDGRLPPAARH